MAQIANSSITASADPSAWFSPAGTSFVVDVDLGVVMVEVRRDAGDIIPKMLKLSVNGILHPVAISGPASMAFDAVVTGRQYRLTPMSGLATAQALE